MTAPVTLADLAHRLYSATVARYSHGPAALPLDYFRQLTAAAPIKSAIMLLAAGLYANREDIAERQLHSNETFYRLLAPYRLMTA